MATKVRLSKKGSIDIRDIVRGLIIASITSALVVIQSSIESGVVTFNWKQIAMSAIGGGVAYILKNWLLEPAKVVTEVSSNIEAKEVYSLVPLSQDLDVISLYKPHVETMA